MKNGAVTYARVSTAEQANTNHSLSNQQRKFQDFCTRNNLPIIAEFVDRGESARTADRPEFQRMLQYCKANRQKISHLIVADLSRLARNVLDQGNTVVGLAELNIKLVSCDEANLDESAAGKLLKNVLGSMHQFFSDSLSEKTKARMRAAVEAGRFPWPAPIGYLNRNKQLVIDPENGPLVIKSYELMASGRYATQDEVLQAVTALGLRTHRGRPVKKQTFSRMLQNAIYTGWIVTNGLKVRGVHEPLVSEALFEQVQQRMNRKSVPHVSLHDDFPLRGFVKCAGCGKALTSGYSKGRSKTYARYWCWEKSCANPVGIGKDDLEMHWVRLLGMMQPTAELLAKLPELAANQWAARNAEIAKEAQHIMRKLEEEKETQQRAVRARLYDKISERDFDELKRNVAENIFKLEGQMAALDAEKRTYQELTEQARTQMLDFVAAWRNACPREKQELPWALFPEEISYDAINRFFAPANVTLWQALRSMFEELSLIGVPGGI